MLEWKEPMMRRNEAHRGGRMVHVSVKPVILEGNLCIPADVHGIVVFAHGSGSSRTSPRNLAVADVLQRGGLATLLFDLLTPEEEQIDARTNRHRFDLDLLARRLAGAVVWLKQYPDTHTLQVGCFGASTGGGAALLAAAQHPELIDVIVSRGGRPDLAGTALPYVRAPTLLIVGGDDPAVRQMNEDAFLKIRATKHLAIVPGASHLFEEPGALEQVACLARDWFCRYLSQGTRQRNV